MASSLSNLVNNLAEGIRKTKCKYGHNDKICETCGVKYKNYDCFLEYTNFTNGKDYQKRFDENLRKLFFYTYKFSNFLLLRKRVYPYEYIDHWEKSKKLSLHEYKDF